MSQAESQHSTRAPKHRAPRPPQANSPEREHDYLQGLRRRFEAAAETLVRVRDQLKAREPQNGRCHDDREHDDAGEEGLDPDGERL